MRSGLIEVHNIRLEETVELLLMEDQEVIQAFSSHAPQKAFADGIRLRSPVRRPKHFDATGCCHSGKTRPEFAVIIPNEVFWPFPIRSRLPQLLRDPEIGRRSCHIHVDDLARLQLDDEESKDRTEEEIRHLQEITGPHLCSMIAQERFPVLSPGSFWANVPHILLDSPFTHPDIQLEEFSTDALCSPESVVCCQRL